MNQKEQFKKVRLFSSIFAKSKKRIIAKLLSSETYTLLEKERILKEIDEELRKLSDQSDSWFNTNLKGAYKEGSSDIVGYLEKLGVKRMIYDKYDTESIANLVGNSKMLMNEAISGIHRSSSNILSKHTKAKLQAVIAEGRVEKQTLKEITNSLVKEISKNEVYLLDSHGRRWDIEKYSELFARTEMMNTYNQGSVNQMLHRGLDLAYVTSYASCQCDICQAWEGKVISLTGKTEGYPTLDDAYADGLFHPNCKHRIRPYYEEPEGLNGLIALPDEKLLQTL